MTHSVLTEPQAEASAGSRTASRVAAVASVLFGVSFFWTVASVNVPHQATDAELLEWWGKDANVTSGMVSLLFAVFTAVLFAVVTNHVLLLVGERSRHWAAFARSMAAAFTATLLVSAALRGVIGHLVKVEDGPLPGIDVLRYTTALNYTVLAMVVMATFALTSIALGVLVLRSGILARWQGYVGIVLGAIVLAAAAGLVGAYTVPVAILWSLSTAVAIWRHAGVATPEVPVARADESAAV
jgi:hypothetical protein